MTNKTEITASADGAKKLLPPLSAPEPIPQKIVAFLIVILLPLFIIVKVQLRGLIAAQVDLCGAEGKEAPNQLAELQTLVGGH